MTASPPDPAAPASREELQSLWETGPHSDTYVLDPQNRNESCTRCHSPANWAPQSGSGSSGQLLKAIRSGGFISEADWKGINCAVCHPGEPDQISGEIATYEPGTPGDYRDVESTTELCQGCHSAAEAEGHASVLVEGIHADLTCADCHDPHAGTASCTASGCHLPFAQECEPIQTHDKPHREVTCSACHDSQAFAIGWNDEAQAWDTFRLPTDLPSAELVPFTSHALTRVVDCDRCHAPGNHPWGY